MNYFRHGDVTIEQLSEIPEKYKGALKIKTKKAVVALGEVTGHHHRVIPVGDSTVEMVAAEDGKKPDANNEDIVLVITGEGLLIHEEHEPILLKTGIYSRGIKRQFNPFIDSVELVRD